eukprot:NODE_309_length_10065_cov_0.706101.p8 type:complete len:188 gc:universal NODE_309_length_10065_cov_0.706101:5274-5837(+)
MERKRNKGKTLTAELMPIFENLKVSSLVGAHVYIDYSNVYYGALNYCPRFDSDLFLKCIDDLTAKLPHIKKVVVSSLPIEAERYGYEVHQLPKMKRRELFVDELLYAKIGDSLLDYQKGLLVLVTGDGNLSTFGLGFSMQIVRAIHREWTVRLLGWKNDISHIYVEIEKKYTKFSIHYLDHLVGRIS